MKGFLGEINRKNERINELGLKYFPIGCSMYSTLIGILSVVYCYLKYGYVRTDHLYYPAKFVYVSRWTLKRLTGVIMKVFFFSRLPWNQQTVSGYFGYLVFIMLGTATYYFVNTLFMLLFSSICDFHKAFKMNTKHLLNKLDELTSIEPIPSANLREIPIILCEIVKNNVKGKE